MCKCPANADHHRRGQCGLGERRVSVGRIMYLCLVLEDEEVRQSTWREHSRGRVHANKERETEQSLCETQNRIYDQRVAFKEGHSKRDHQHSCKTLYGWID